MLAMQQQQQQANEPTGAAVHVSGVTFQPPGADVPLLQDASLTLPPNELGLIYGRSGSGKTTLLHILAGLQEQTSGSILTGLVFQFPERHFLGATMAEEITFAWPRRPQDVWDQQQLMARAGATLQSVGLAHIDPTTPLRQLSDGYKRRVALAVQMVRKPALLLLDEPLAGLDWRVRAEVAAMLGELKKECTVLVVSHDLRELSPLVDKAWRMQPGGVLEPAAKP
ncbi:hypothetical protein WJX72_001086 [[Myrmecia] bisecta]|uniref:ABC transporter domain-containing protein n=1 Tax=[Myrmecia] bisecta TaxID=41462 RepID=A0AAW1Q3C5_9CHLO